jgi:hypothetical protein
MTAWEHVFRQQLGAAVAQLRQEGFAPPLYCAFMDREGSLVYGRYEDRGRRGLSFTIEASHMAAPQVTLPIHVLIVDQHGEAAHVALDLNDDASLVVN